MANVLVEEQSLKDIADSIRGKLGSSSTYKPSQMAEAIEQILGEIKGGDYMVVSIDNGDGTQELRIVDAATNLMNADKEEF